MAEYGRYISMFQEDKIMDLIEYLQDKNLLPRQRACVNCNHHPMNIQKFRDSPDGITFRCTKCKSRISLRKNTFFEKSKLSLGKIMQLMLRSFFFLFFIPSWCCKGESRLVSLKKIVYSDFLKRPGFSYS